MTLPAGLGGALVCVRDICRSFLMGLALARFKITQIGTNVKGINSSGCCCLREGGALGESPIHRGPSAGSAFRAHLHAISEQSFLRRAHDCGCPGNSGVCRAMVCSDDAGVVETAGCSSGCACSGRATGSARWGSDGLRARARQQPRSDRGFTQRAGWFRGNRPSDSQAKISSADRLRRAWKPS